MPIFRWNTEESKVGRVAYLTSIVMFVTGLLAIADEDQFLVPYILGAYAILTIAIVAAGLYESRIKKVKPEPQDERSALCSLKATRNAFLFALVLMAFYMILGAMGAPLVRILALQTIFGVSLAVYSMSYLYYKRVE